MEVISADAVGQEAAIQAAVFMLKQGGVIAIPTETTYGLSCDPRNTKAVARILAMKGSDPGKVMLLVASSVGQVKKVARLSGKSLVLSRPFWPGPLTLVLPVRTQLPEVSVRQGEIAIRVSSSPIVQSIARQFRFPIISTSANRSGEPDCRSGREVIQVFSSLPIQPDLLLDTGVLPYQKPSTIARVREDGAVEVLRQGAIQVPSMV